MNTTIAAILQLALILFVSPLLIGIINRTKAWAAGRRGAPVIQPYYDLWRLLNKKMVISRTTSWVFPMGPIVGFSACLVAGLLVPLGFRTAPISFTGDLILYIYLFALARFFTVNAAMDTGSAFEGMGAVREVTYASLVEPTICVIFIALAKITGTFSLSSILLSPYTGAHLWFVAGLVLVALSWFIVLLVENCRVPFDDPNTHLELTMIHEVMVLDHSGPAFGLILWGAAVKMFLSAAILVSIILPKFVPSELLGWPLFLASVFLTAISVGVVESVAGRIRLPLVPKFLLRTALLAFVGMMLVMR